MKPEQVTAWINGFGGRRFLMTMCAGVTSTILFILHQLTQGNFMILQEGTILMYLAANNQQKTVEAKNGTP